MNSVTAATHARILISCFIYLNIFFLIQTAYVSEETIPFIISVFIILCIILLFHRPEKHWKPFQKDIATLILIGMIVFKDLYFGEEIGLSIPFVAFIGYRFHERRAMYYAAFLGLFSTFSFYMTGKYDFALIASFIITYIGWYIGARGFSLQQQVKEKDQEHLLQLQKAHDELQEAHSQLQDASVNTLRAAVLEERTRIARDVHDALGHSLTSVIVQLNALKYMLQGGPSDAQEAVQNMLVVAKHSLEDIRSSVHTLAEDKSFLGITPLQALLSRAQQHTGIKMELTCPDPDIPLSQHMTIALYRILQEAVTNALRHSDATEIFISIEEKQKTIFLTIQDNGSITSHQQIKPGFGLTGIAERIKQLNGTFSYSIRQPQGFQINVSFPLR